MPCGLRQPASGMSKAVCPTVNRYVRADIHEETLRKMGRLLEAAWDAYWFVRAEETDMPPRAG